MIKGTNIGAMDRRITIKNFTKSKNAFGEDVRVYAPFKTVWCKVKEMAGDKPYDADKLNTVIKKEFTIRFLAGFDTTSKIEYQNLQYDILSIDTPDRDRTMIIKAEYKQSYE